MERKKYDEVDWYRANLFGMIVFVTENRIDRRDLPDSPYVYELRHDDDGDWTTPVEICNSVLVNFCMTLVSFEPLPVNLKYHYVSIEHGDFWMRPDTKYNLEALEKHFRGSRFNIPPDRIHHYSTTLFISQPFTGKDINEIKKQRKLLHELYALYTERPIEYVNLINQFDPEDKDEYRYGPEGSQRFNQYTFCRSIGMMGSADVVLFYGDWEKSRGCKIERKICDQYCIPKLSQRDLIRFCIDHPEYDDDYFMTLWRKDFFNAHPIADVMIEMVEGSDLFKASLKSNDDKDAWHQLEGYGNSPNDAYMDLNRKLDDNFENDSDAIAEKIFNEQLEKLSSATGVKVAICDDAETITDEDIEKSLKLNEPFDNQTEEMISEVKRHKPDLDLAIFKETLKHMSVPERKAFIQEMLNGLKGEEVDNKSPYEFPSITHLRDIVYEYIRSTSDKTDKIGGSWYADFSAGAFYWHCYTNSSNTYAFIGACLCKNDSNGVCYYEIYNDHYDPNYVNITIYSDSIKFNPESRFADFDKDFMYGLYEHIKKGLNYNEEKD